jgi:hypothetical protein
MMALEVERMFGVEVSEAGDVVSAVCDGNAAIVEVGKS